MVVYFVKMFQSLRVCAWFLIKYITLCVRNSGWYDGAEGSFIWNFPRSLPMKFHMQFRKNTSWSDISYEIWYEIPYEILHEIIYLISRIKFHMKFHMKFHTNHLKFSGRWRHLAFAHGFCLCINTAVMGGTARSGLALFCWRVVSYS